MCSYIYKEVLVNYNNILSLVVCKSTRRSRMLEMININMMCRPIIVMKIVFLFCSPSTVFHRCEEPRFVRGWYRPASRATSGSASPYQQTATRASAATVHSTTGEESIYESADHPPSCRNACNTPDSERYASHAQTRHRRYLYNIIIDRYTE